MTGSGDSFGLWPANPSQPARGVASHTLRSASGLAIRLLELGAILDRVEVPGPDGPESLVLSVPDLAARGDRTANPYLGASVGRWVNRIGAARFTLDGVNHDLDRNEGENQLHGGTWGLSWLVWDAEPDDDRVSFRISSPDGDMGFPGHLEVEATYVLEPDRIAVEYRATTDAPTVVAFTNHAYWNLGGPGEASVADHVVTLDADRVVEVDEGSLPMGPPQAVEGTAFDLRDGVRLGDRIGSALPHGYDHAFVRDGVGMRRHGLVEHGRTGRALEVWSDQPAAQFYTGGFLAGAPGVDGRTNGPFAGLCVEPGPVPDAPNRAWAPSPVLRPGEEYRHRIEFRFPRLSG